MTTPFFKRALTLATLSTLAAGVMAQTNFDIPTWKISSTTATGSLYYSWFTTNSLERGFAYNAATGNLLVASRSSGNRIRKARGSDGADLGFVPDAGFTGGGGAVLNKVGVTSDGIIFAVNLDTAQGFKIYRAADENTTFTTVYTQSAGDDSASDREGDTLLVRRLSNGVIQLITANTAAAPAIIIYTSTDNGLTFTRARFPFTGITGGGSPTVVADPVDVANLWYRSSGNTNNTARIDGVTSAATLFADNLARGAVIGVAQSTSSLTQRLVYYTGGNSTNPTLSRNTAAITTNVDSFNSTRQGTRDATLGAGQTFVANGNSAGEVIVVGTTVYILHTNNSITRNDGITLPVSMSEFTIE